MDEVNDAARRAEPGGEVDRPDVPTIKDQTRDKPILTLELNHAALVAGIVDLATQIPPELLPIDAARHAEFVAGVAALNAARRMWEGRAGGYTVKNLPGFGFSPLSLVRCALADLPDAVPSGDTAGLEFIDDAPLRQVLRLDISTMTSALRNGEWKAATVIAGSVIEALLLWAVSKHTDAERQAAAVRVHTGGLLGHRPGGDPNDWHLPEYLEVAGQLGCIIQGTLDEGRRVREYRNLIHPGATRRTGQQCDLGTAHVAIGAVDHVTGDLAASEANHQHGVGPRGRR